MASFTFGPSSLAKLEGIHPDLHKLCMAAIDFSYMDFGIIEGLRTKDRQAHLVKDGKSQTMNSRHITGHAIDFMPYYQGKYLDAWPYFYPVADAFAAVSKTLNIPIVWGSSWGFKLIHFNFAQASQDAYIRQKIRKGQTLFLDGPHIELDREDYPATDFDRNYPVSA